MISDFGIRISEWKKKASQIRNLQSLYLCENVENPS